MTRAGQVQPHGTRTRYSLNGCRCDRCRSAHAAYERDRKAGLRRSVPSGVVRAHLEQLLADGWTLHGLAAHTGYDRTNLRHILSGRRQWTASLTAEDILSVPVSEVAA